MNYAIYHLTCAQLASCFHQSFDESTLKDLQGAYRDSQSFGGLLPLLRRSSYPWVVLSVDRLFSGPIAQISRDKSRSVILRNLGLGWISLSRFFLDLYIPDTPLDPAALQSFRSEFWGAELASLSHELELEVNLERRISSTSRYDTFGNAHITYPTYPGWLDAIFSVSENFGPRFHILCSRLSQRHD